MNGKNNCKKKYSYRTGDEKKCYKLMCSPTKLCEKHWRNTDMEGNDELHFIT